MSERQEIRFCDIFQIPLKNGLTKPSRIRGEGIRMINMKEIFAYDVINDSTPMESVPLYDNEQTSYVEYDDLLFARQSLVEAGAGKIAIFKGKEKTVFESHLIRCRIDSKRANPDFVYYLFKSPMGKGVMSSIVTQTAAAGIKGSDLQNLVLPFPPLPEQKAIAAVLSSLDDKIDLLHRQNKTLEAMAEALFRKWFIEEADEGWEEGKLGDILVVKYGKDHQKLVDGGIPVYGSGGIMRYVNTALYAKESVLIPRKGSLSNIVYINEPFWTVDTMFFTEMKIINATKYVYFLVKSKDLASLNVGSAVPSMTTDILNNMIISIPAPDILKQFEQIISPMFLKMQANQKNIRTLEKQRDALLPKLMSGDIKIKE